MAGKGTSDMMGSKADMVSRKLDEVKRNKIWMEHVNKEDAKAAASQEGGGGVSKFQQNVKTMIPITPNPNRVDFSKINDLDFSKMEETLKKMEHVHKTPEQKQAFPMTAQQEIGWFSNEDAAAQERRKRSQQKWYKGSSSCEITAYAAAYSSMAGQNPFSDKSTR